MHDLKNCKLQLELFSDKLEEIKWVIYAHQDLICTENSFQDLLRIFDFNNASKIMQFALALCVKQETHEWLTFRNCPADAFENVKNTLLVPHPNNPYVLKTIRGHYIDYGQEKRKIDPLVWAKIVNAQIEKIKLEDGIIDCITDFRFENELLERKFSNGYIQSVSDITTIRLHRKDVPVAAPLADRSIDSEHNLDQFQTKYLFIPPGEAERKIAMERFPQYKDYVPIFVAVNHRF